MKNVRLIQKDESAVSPVIATILMVAITVVLAAVLYVMVSGLITSPGGQVRSIGINPGSAGTNHTLLFSTVPAGLAKVNVNILIRNPSGVIVCQLTPLQTNLIPLAGTAAGCVNVWYSPVTSGANVQAQDTILIYRGTGTAYPSGSSVELSDSAGILAKVTL